MYFCKRQNHCVPTAWRTTYQDNYCIMQRPISVQSFNVVFYIVFPFHTQVDERSGSGLLPFSIQNIVSCSLVLNCWRDWKSDSCASYHIISNCGGLRETWQETWQKASWTNPTSKCCRCICTKKGLPRPPHVASKFQSDDRRICIFDSILHHLIHMN